MSDFWDKIVRKFGAREDIINIPGAPHVTNKYIDRLEYRALKPYLSSSEGEIALDVGTGIGRWASLLAEKAAYVVGIDISRQMARIAKRRVNRTNTDFLVATAFAIPLRSNCVDLSLSCTCIQHIVDEEKQRESLQEMTRVTKDKILVLELMSRSGRTNLAHYPTLVVPRDQYVSSLMASGIKSIIDIGVDFLPLIKLAEKIRNFLFKKLGVKVPSYEGNVKQRVLRSSYQIISVFALFFSLPFNEITPNPSSDLTRHVLLVARKHRKRAL